MTATTYRAAPRTAREAAELLAAQGKHSHLHAEHETVCISGHCTPALALITTPTPRWTSTPARGR